jgi:hypothetical protein
MPTQDAFDLFVSGLTGLRRRHVPPCGGPSTRPRRPAGPASRPDGSVETKQPARHRAADTPKPY